MPVCFGAGDPEITAWTAPCVFAGTFEMIQILPPGTVDQWVSFACDEMAAPIQLLEWHAIAHRIKHKTVMPFIQLEDTLFSMIIHAPEFCQELLCAWALEVHTVQATL